MSSGQTFQADPVAAYIIPIRSVLFIDDGFPLYSTFDPSAAEADRARALWEYCVDRGWMCDIDNRVDWDSEERTRRLAACDLLVLDYHLVPHDTRPSLRIIRKLALSPTPNLVVIYTAERALERVLLSAAAAARGRKPTSLSADVREQLDELPHVDWTTKDLVSYLKGGNDWMRSFIEVYEGPPALARQVGEAALEKSLFVDAETTQDVVLLDDLRSEANRHWFQAKNLFVAVVGKPTVVASEEPPDEAGTLISGLEEAVRDWNPSWLACLLARSRGRVQAGAFGDDNLHFPDPSLPRGLLHYISAAEDADEKLRRGQEIAGHLIARRFEEASRQMGADLVGIAKGAGPASSDRADESSTHTALLNLNAFLCSHAFEGHHLTTGTIFRTAPEETKVRYWVCVSPACDMVPRKPGGTNPWARRLDPMRPFIALELDTLRGREKKKGALDVAERGRHIFFHDPYKTGDALVVAAAANPRTNDPNPPIEQVFAEDRGRVKNRRVWLQNLQLSAKGQLDFVRFECVAVAQLRPAYADRLTHMIGSHLSRVGVDFFKGAGLQGNLPNGASEP